MDNLVAITIGDIDGIGIRILLKIWKKRKNRNFILFTNINYLENLLKKNKIKININIVNKNKNELIFNEKIFNVFTYKCNSSNQNTYKSLKYAYQFCKKKICIGVITLPLSKELIKKINKNFIGHTEYFQKLDKKKYSNMILFHEKIIVTPLTTHIEVKKISKVISNEVFIYNQINNLIKTLKKDFNIKQPKIIISGLNPHAGENGKLGNEEIKIISPAVKKLKSKGIKIQGPYSADSLLINKNLKYYDCFIFLFHDQALIPFKYISQFSGVNYTGNLSIIRTSPDHGTAYNLVDSKNISDKSLLNCFKLIKEIHFNRKHADKT